MGGGQVLANSPQFSGLPTSWQSDCDDDEEGSDFVCSNGGALSDSEELKGHEEPDVCSTYVAPSKCKEPKSHVFDAVCFSDGASSQCEGRRMETVNELSLSSFSLTSSTSKELGPQEEMKRRLVHHYETLVARNDFRQTRRKLCRYTPGSSMLFAKGRKGNVYSTPDVTTLLVVGYKGAGKSTLINNVLRVINNKSTGLYRAPVSDDLTESGTHFIGEYLVLGSLAKPRMSIFDTRGLSKDSLDETQALLESWMREGVRHGQMDLRASDSKIFKETLETRGRFGGHHFSRKRNVNFVIFVIDAVLLLQMKRDGETDKLANLVQLYKNPYLSFKDDQPVVVMTHGDMLSHGERICARIYIGEVLGISPVEQIFDISGVSADIVKETDFNSGKDISVLDMLTFSLECADRHLLPKTTLLASFNGVVHLVTRKYNALDADRKIALMGMIACVYVLLILCISACISLSFMFKKMVPHHKICLWDNLF